MHKKTFLTLTLAILAFIAVLQLPGNETVHSQGRPTVTPEMLEKRRAVPTFSRLTTAPERG